MDTKTFYELTEDQQDRAISMIKVMLADAINLEIIESESELSDHELEKLAIMAAEGTPYTQDGLPLMNDPSLYGGCV